MALRSQAKDVTKKVDAVPAELAHDPGLIYERARYRRKQDDLPGMVALFDKPLTNVPRPDLLWRELDSAARHALDTKQYKIAYNLAKQHGAKNGTTFAEGEWLAGWIALRFVKDANAAYGHFTAMFDGVSSPLSKARAAYWAGRAATALNKKADADRWYWQASLYPTTYYGQLGAGEIGVNPPLPMPEMPKPDPTGTGGLCPPGHRAGGATAGPDRRRRSSQDLPDGADREGRDAWRTASRCRSRGVAGPAGPDPGRGKGCPAKGHGDGRVSFPREEAGQCRHAGDGAWCWASSARRALSIRRRSAPPARAG